MTQQITPLNMPSILEAAIAKLGEPRHDQGYALWELERLMRQNVKDMNSAAERLSRRTADFQAAMAKGMLVYADTSLSSPAASFEQSAASLNQLCDIAKTVLDALGFDHTARLALLEEASKA